MDAFKKSKPAQGTAAAVVAVVCLVLWLNTTAGGAAELAAMGLADDSRALLVTACATQTAEQSGLTGQVSPYDVPVCKCVMGIDALTAIRNGRKTSVTVPSRQHIAGDPIHVSFTGATDEKVWIAVGQVNNLLSLLALASWRVGDRLWQLAWVL